ncbi:unnamed protein product [Eruca vesicaria subsp. sativa]|uniref:Uncharacterized protein n=1 Tax=Eruca vesicaria subsp. sativa TaxID=29727 RepID=A0ABC8ITS1_ERUVS|nr:unnamed protein product [Eruca vesicaria subsp. sativa]
MLNPNAPSYRRRLSAHAQPFEPADLRSLYLTFSNGFPLKESQIFHFFNGLYPSLVEKVSVPRPKRGSGPSLHGKVVFKNAVIPFWVMQNHEKVGFFVDGRPFYCSKFVSKKTITAPTTSTSLPDGESHPGGKE